MAESLTHARLVETLVKYAEQEFGHLGNVAFYADRVSTAHREPPERIGGHIPDLVVRDVPQTWVMIGEAKTREDLETDRSRRQIRAFLDYLSHTPNGTFVLCVPVAAQMTARNLIEEVAASFPESRTRTLVLDPTGTPAG